MIQLYGLPSVFITIAPAEGMSPFLLRLSRPCDSVDSSDSDVKRDFKLPPVPECFKAASEFGRGT